VLSLHGIDGAEFLVRNPPLTDELAHPVGGDAYYACGLVDGERVVHSIYIQYRYSLVKKILRAYVTFSVDNLSHVRYSSNRDKSNE